MKNILGLMAVIILAVNVGYAADASFVRVGGANKTTNGTLANEGGLTYTRNYYVSPGSYDADKISSVMTMSSVTFSNVTFSTNAYTSGSGNISITAHGLTMGVPVSITGNPGNVPPPLVTGTTYFAIPVSANVVQLATTAVKSQASDFIIMGSSKPTDGTQTYTLHPSSQAVCLATFTFYGSNDGDRFFTITSSAPAVYGGGIWDYDFSSYNYTTLKLGITIPATGGAGRGKSSLNLKQ